MTQASLAVPGSGRDCRDPIRSYPSYVAGRDEDGDGWVHVLHPRALLDDAFASLTAKRKLDQGRLAVAATAPGVVVGRVARASDASIAAALRAAAAAAPLWRAFPQPTRVEGFLTGLRRRLVERAEEIVELLTLEGHPRDLARWELSGMLDGLSPDSRAFYSGQLSMEFTDATGRRLLVRRQPDGVVCVNPPANAPMASALLASTAIAAGNAVVVRAPRSMPLGTMYAMRELVAPVLTELGAPPGVLSVLCGDPAPMLSAWLASAEVDDIMYFGSSENGVRFEADCVAAGKKPILELAGNDAVVVWKDADLPYAAEALAESFYGSGQLCMIPNQALVHPDVAGELLRLLAEAAARMRPGYPDQDGVLLTPVLRQDRFFGCLRDALDHGAQLVCGGYPMELDGSRSGSGMFLAPTVLRVDGLHRSRQLEAVARETFFPLLPVVVPEPAPDDQLLDQLIAFVNSNRYGLRNSLWAHEEAVVARFVTEVTNGGLLKINDSHVGFLPRLPSHGGTGLTGGVFGEANYPILRTTHLQGVAISPRGRRPADSVFGALAELHPADRPAPSRGEEH